MRLVKIQLIKSESKTDADVPSKDEDFDSPKGEIKEESSENSQDSTSENIELKEMKLEIPKLEIKNESSSQDGKEAASHKYLKCASCCKNLEGSGNMLAWDMHVFCDDICLSKFFILL